MIEESVLERVLSSALRGGAEFAEVYAEDKRSSSAYLDDGKVEQVTSGRDRGAGIRVVAGETTGFAHTADLSERGLTAAAEVAASAARSGNGRSTVVALTPSPAHAVNRVDQRPDEVPKATKVELLARIDAAARESSGSVVQVSVSYGDSRKGVLVANTE